METTLNMLTKAAGWSFIHSLWQGALLYAVLWIVFLALPKLKAKTKHDLAFVSLMGTFVWFIFTFFHELTLISQSQALTTTAALQQQMLMAQLDQALTKSVPSVMLKAEQSFPLLMVLYIIGLVVQTALLLSGYYKVWQTRTQGLSNIPVNLRAQFISILMQMGIKRKISFKLSSRVTVPVVMGFIKPIVLLPAAIALRLDPQQLESIIIHELAHIKRNDYLLNLIKVSIETLMFFNPFVWLTGKFINAERENACDDLVVKLTQNPLSYAQTLLQLENLKQTEPTLAMALSRNKYHLLNRIRRITDMKTKSSTLKPYLFVMALTVATALSIAWVYPNKTKQPVKHIVCTEKTSSKDTVLKTVSPVLFATNVKDSVPVVKVQTNKKSKVHIVIEDEKGNKKEYNSFDELPRNLNLGDSSHLVFTNMKFITSPEWKKQQAEIQANAEAIRKQFSSPEWKKQQAEIQANAEEIRKQFNSPEWKKQQAEIQANAKALKKHLNSPEWKRQMENIHKNSEELKKYFNSPEWKKQQEEIRKNAEEINKQFNSPEWKKQMEDVSLKSSTVMLNGVGVLANNIAIKDANTVVNLNRNISLNSDTIITVKGVAFTPKQSKIRTRTVRGVGLSSEQSHLNAVNLTGRFVSPEQLHLRAINLSGRATTPEQIRERKARLEKEIKMLDEKLQQEQQKKESPKKEYNM